MKRNNIGGAIGGIALGLAVAVGVVVVRHYRAQENAPAPQLVRPSGPGELDKLSDAIADLAARLDAQEGRVARAENRALPVADRQEAALAAHAGDDELVDALKRLSREVGAFVPATGADADRFDQFRPRLKELGERTVRLAERLDAVTAQLTKEEPGGRKDKP